MYCRLFALSACIALAPVRVDASDAATYAYAATLRVFAPGLAPPVALRLADRVIRESDAAGIDARLIVALIAVESSWNASARSPRGARGLGGLMPATAAMLGVDAGDADANVHGTVVYLHAMLERYSRAPASERYRLALAAYNAGPGAVDRAGGIPPYAETRTYITRVIALWRRLVLG